MSTPQNSVKPVVRTGSSPLLASGKTSAVQLSEEVSGWIEGMSPTGASVYDTGWTDITPAGGFTAANAQVRRIGSVVYFRGTLAGTVNTGVQTTIGTVPVGFRPGSADWAIRSIHVASFSNNTFWASVNTAGAINVIPPVSGAQTLRLGGLSGYTVD